MFDFNNYFVQQTLQRVLELGFTREDYFSQLPQFINTPINQIPEEYIAQLIRHSRVLAEDEFWGYLPSHCPIGTYNYAFRLAKESLNIKELLPRFAKFYKTFIPDMEFNFIEDISAIEINLPETLSRNAFPHIFINSIIYLTLNWLTGKQIQLKRVETHLNAEDIPCGLDALFGCPIYTQATHNKIYLKEQEKNLLIIRSNDEIEDHLETRPLSVIRFNKKTDYSTQVQQYLLRRIELNQDMKDLTHAALHFGVSAQSLRRHLGKQAISFREIKRNVQEDMASKLLIETQQSIENISDQVGFIEANSFPRAFRRWTGLSPTEFREKHQSDTF